MGNEVYKMNEADIKERENYLEIHLKALPQEIKELMDIKQINGSQTLGTFEEKELFKAILREEVRRKYRAYDNWEECNQG